MPLSREVLRDVWTCNNHFCLGYDLGLAYDPTLDVLLIGLSPSIGLEYVSESHAHVSHM